MVVRTPCMFAVLLALACAPFGACGGSGGGPAAAAVQRLFTLLLSTINPLDPAPVSEVEIVDLASFAKVGGFTLPGVVGSSLAVSPDGMRLYIADLKGAQVLVRTPTGGVLGAIPFAGVVDVLLDASGLNLWVGSSQPAKVARYDAITLAAGPSVTGIGSAGGLALSPDGTKLAWTSYSGAGHAITGAYIANATTLASPTPILFTGSACNMLPNDVSFVTNARLVVWDASCDRLHQIDATAGTYIGNASDVALTVDAGASYNSNNVLVVQPTLTRVFGFKESSQVWRIDPFGLTSTLPAGLTGSPFLVAMDVAQSNLYVHNVIAPVTLDRITTVTETVTPDVYTFTSTLAYPRDAVVRNVVP